MNTLLLAWRYTTYNRGRSITLIAALTIMIFLPLATRWVTQTFEAKALARAQETPLVVGAKGSRFAVALHALYFRGETPSPIKYSEVQRLEEFKLAEVIPVYSRFRAAGKAIIGTSPDYFRLRRLSLASGEPIARLGDCVVGSGVASELEIAVGAKLLSEPENMIDLSSAAPLRMRVTGILQPTGTADDDVIFCMLQTTWIIEGIGHGHTMNSDDPSEHTHPASQQNLSLYQEVTDENLKSFHFHGNRADYPISSIILIPDSERSSTLLQGKYLDPTQNYQIIRPVEVVAELMEVVSRVRKLFELGIISLILAAGLLMCLVLILSTRLRERELRTMFLLGCSRMKMVTIVATELGMIVLVSAALAVTLAWLMSVSAEGLMIRLV